MKLSEKITALTVMSFITFISTATIFGNTSAEALPKPNGQAVLDGTYTDSLISSIADSFAWRDTWRTVGAEINARIGEPVVNGIYITSERLLSVESHPIEDIIGSADKVNSFAENYNGAIYFAAIPTSTGIYGDVLPSYILSSTEKQQADSLYEALSVDIRKIDAYTILKMLSDNYIYYRTDTKWTSYGAYCVYRTVIQKLGFMPVSYDKYTIRHVTDSYRGNLYSRANYMESKPDLLDVYEYDDGTEITECIGCDSNGISRPVSLYDINAVESNDPYNVYLGSSMPFIKINTTVNNDRKLLVIGDEYADCFIPFLTKHYSEIAFISADCLNNGIEKYIDSDDYEQTLFLLGIDSLSGDILNYEVIL